MNAWLSVVRTPEEEKSSVERAQALPLREAVLCLQCDTLHHVQRATCPACGGRQSFPVTRWLRSIA
jgi:hypothetical protein